MPLDINKKTRIVENRLAALQSLMSPCVLCPRKCGVNRRAGEKGFCKTGDIIKIASWAQHRGEEPPISGSKGSGTIFASGCTFACLFCQNFPFSQLGNGQLFTPAELGKTFSKLAQRGAHNLNFVTPTHVIPMLLEAWLHASDEAKALPIVYNCSGYESERVIDLLDQIIDIYLPDIKYASNQTSKELSCVSDYVAVNRRTLEQMHKQVGLLAIDNKSELATRGMIIRHLVLPQNLSGSEESFTWLKEKLGTEVHISLMSQYFPAHQAHNHPEMCRKVSMDEYLRTLDLIENLGFANVWAQDPTECGCA